MMQPSGPLTTAFCMFLQRVWQEIPEVNAPANLMDLLLVPRTALEGDTAQEALVHQ